MHVVQRRNWPVAKIVEIGERMARSSVGTENCFGYIFHDFTDVGFCPTHSSRHNVDSNRSLFSAVFATNKAF